MVTSLKQLYISFHHIFDLSLVFQSWGERGSLCSFARNQSDLCFRTSSISWWNNFFTLCLLSLQVGVCNRKKQ